MSDGRAGCAVAPFGAVGRALLAAHLPPKEAPTGYNEVRGRLWVSLQANRTLPTGEDFEASWRSLRDAIVEARARRQSAALDRALEALDSAWAAATETGLLARWETG